MQKVNGLTPGMIEQNISKMREMFPEVFTNSKLDKNKLMLLLGESIEEDEESYEFSWRGKKAAIRLGQEPTSKTLQPRIEKSIDWDRTNNIYIEGDNLDALKILQQSYQEKVKMIYIDPPYNTGMGFIFNDNFREPISSYKTSASSSQLTGRFHSNWLSFMYPRLMLARRLLTEDGMIFISINDKELYNLKKVCDEIFGEENFVTTLIWEKKKKPSFLDRNVGCVTEYILVFSKNNEKSHALSIEKTEEGKKYPFNNAGNTLRTLTFPENAVTFRIPDTIVNAQDMSAGKIITELLDDVVIENGRNKNTFRLKGEWRYSQEKVYEIVKNREEIVISKVPFRPNHVKRGGKVKKMRNLFSIAGYGFPTYEDADKEITDIFGKKIFDYSKPERLIRGLIQSLLYNDNQAIVLDFFSGSGTTGEAVWRLNNEFGTNHQFILVQLPEKIDSQSAAYHEGFQSISEIGRERLKRSKERLFKQNSRPNQDLGFKFFHIDDN
ncbi:site-specific DNA-methyltransferase [Oceanobacillus halophilus]|nr:site-specific DNA-methyltransferase [Oceanobacillus halophilus]